MLSLWQAEANARQQRPDAGLQARRRRFRSLPEDSGLCSNRTFLAGPRAPNMLRAAQSTTTQRGVRGYRKRAAKADGTARRNGQGRFFVPFEVRARSGCVAPTHCA